MKIISKIVEGIIQKEIEKKAQNIEEDFRKKESELKESYQTKISELELLNSRLQLEIIEVNKSRQKIENEEKRLWERLDILRDNLNTEDVWMKLWECAFSKSVNIVWDIMKDKTIDLVNIAREESYDKSKKEFEENYKIKIEEFIKNSQNPVNVPLLMDIRNKANKEYLNCNRIKNYEKENYYLGQLDLIKQVMPDEKI